MIRLSLRALIALCAAMAVYVSVLSWRGARAKAKYKAEELVEQACDSLEIFGGTGDNLRHLARFIIDREM